MKLFLFIVNLFFSIHFFAQVDAQFSKIDKKIDLIPKEYNTSTEAIANYIHSNFKSDDDKIRAVFYWTASNLTYDFQNMFVLKNNLTPDKRINQTLLSKKGICGDYAAVFNSIATLVGIKSIVVSGYTKQNGKIDILSGGNFYGVLPFEGRYDANAGTVMLNNADSYKALLPIRSGFITSGETRDIKAITVGNQQWFAVAGSNDPLRFYRRLSKRATLALRR